MIDFCSKTFVSFLPTNPDPPVITTFKTLFKYDAINVTLGLPYIRVSPDHGVAFNIVGKKIANFHRWVKLRLRWCPGQPLKILKAGHIEVLLL